jgi:hypothetical protein
MDMRIMNTFRRESTPTTPTVNNRALNMIYQDKGTMKTSVKSEYRIQDSGARRDTPFAMILFY